ncbi:hypothetical protein AVEN_68492-1 [Araneus ventricosus]|uniref:Uncharacterized protein n=1 Tax=Araneus ventricosus TaxID=182803 RepID=A0A4Y2I5D6_ARAVE|nr:hypothetical protein AVEN_68492-1 [Araneus ventricosus]
MVNNTLTRPNLNSECFEFAEKTTRFGSPPAVPELFAASKNTRLHLRAAVRKMFCSISAHGRYEVKLPINDRNGELCNNYEIACSRKNGLVNRFKKNPDFYWMCQEVINGYLKKGIAEEVFNKPEQMLFYLPHQGVLREHNITTKLRMVFAASAHSMGSPLLNQCMFAGPNLIPERDINELYTA